MAYYDPSHPDADWSGYVSVSSRKHVREPKRGDEEKWKPKKRILASKNNDSTSNLIGGPVPNNPSTLGSCNWQSEAQAASCRTKTTVDQLTETGRSQIRYKNKKLGVPSVKSGNDTVAASLIEDPYYILENGDEPLSGREIAPVPLSTDHDLEYVGYRQITKTSLLATLGKDLYASKQQK